MYGTTIDTENNCKHLNDFLAKRKLGGNKIRQVFLMVANTALVKKHRELTAEHLKLNWNSWRKTKTERSGFCVNVQTYMHMTSLPDERFFLIFLSKL